MNGYKKWGQDKREETRQRDGEAGPAVPLLGVLSLFVDCVALGMSQVKLLRQRWINRLNIRAREWQQARGHKHPDYWFWSLLNCFSQGIRMPSNIYSCTHIKSWQASLLYLRLSFFHYYCLNQTQSSWLLFETRWAGTLWLCFLMSL